jgi:hypothetical protein
MVTALLVPADPTSPVRAIRVDDRAQAYSDLIGGGLLEEVTVRLADGHLLSFYLDEHRIRAGLPDNARAAVLAARLGLHDRGLLAGLRGNLLLTGLDPHHVDTDIPPAVLSAAWRVSLLPEQRDTAVSPPPGAAPARRSGPGTGLIAGWPAFTLR